jgi:hypothetical protein
MVFYNASLLKTIHLILASDMRTRGLQDEVVPCPTMNDVTVKQIAAAKPTVNNGSAI